MRELIKKTNNVTRLDIINAETSKPFKSVVGSEPIIIKGCAITKDVNKETGELMELPYIFAENGDVYGGNSENIARAVDALCELIDEGEKVAFTVESAKANSGREFLSLKLTPVE